MKPEDKLATIFITFIVIMLTLMTLKEIYS